MIANKLYKLSNIKKNFNTCNDILNSSKGKEDLKNYIISHNKISLSNNSQKYINKQNLKKNLNHSENKFSNKNKNKYNSNISEDNDTNIINKKRSESNNKSVNFSINKNNNKSYYRKKILSNDETKDIYKIKIIKKKNKIY